MKNYPKWRYALTVVGHGVYAMLNIAVIGLHTYVVIRGKTEDYRAQRNEELRKQTG